MTHTRFFNTLAVFLLFTTSAISQQFTQVVRGTVIDQVSENPIPGAKVMVVNTDPAIRTLTDGNGIFRMEKVPVGRQTIVVSYMGYKDVVLDGIVIDAGKESVLVIRLEEDIQTYEEVKVVGKRDGPINEMSVVSTHTFSVEETQKYAASVNDPARMATSFAGVVGTQGTNNDISIRGNAPRGMIWRMEGVEIPNPNHFSSVGSSGGGISIINAQLLGTSDFSTGAFAAEYGNALSGVFDLSLRKGNNEKREYTIQAGMMGIDAAVEGPFKKGYNGSYLVNYRYSTLGLLQHIVPIGDAVTNFQDVSFNVFLPTKRIGNFGVFGFGGVSNNAWTPQEDTTLWADEPWLQYEGTFDSNTGMSGLWHKIRFGENAFLKTNVALSGTINRSFDDSIGYDFSKNRLYEESYLQQRFTVSTNYTLKLSARNNFKAGAIYNQIGYRFTESHRQDGTMYEAINESGSTSTAQAFMQLSHKFSETFTLNAGVHYLHLFLNNTGSIEPRVSLQWKATQLQTISFAYGLHGQVQPLGAYFAKVEETPSIVTQPNKDLRMNKAHHVVLAHTFSFPNQHRLRTEIYYQYLYDIAVGAADDSTFSLLNSEYGFATTALESSGTGQNYGVEITFDRSLSNGLYYLIAGSLYESKYTALNGTEYNTRFNTNYTLSITAGKDWTLKNPEKRRTFGFNLKSVLVGGTRYTPYEMSALPGGYPTQNFQRNYTESMPAFHRLDLRISLKRDYAKVTGTVSLDILNTLNRKNPGGQYFDPISGEIKRWYHPGILPVLSYRITF